MTTDNKKRSRPPNKPRPVPRKPAESAKPGKPDRPVIASLGATASKPKPLADPAAAPPKKIITGGMTVEITIGEVRITIEGPVVKVLAVLQWLFGSKDPEAVIARLQVHFGPEVGFKRRV